RIYLRGSFTQVGPNTGQGVVVDQAAATWAQSFPRVNGPVHAAAPDGAGGWFIAGEFSQVGSAFRKNAARITSSGAVSSWNPAVTGAVYALAFDAASNRVYLGGDITSVRGLARIGLAEVSGSTADPDPAWVPAANGT